MADANRSLSQVVQTCDRACTSLAGTQGMGCDDVTDSVDVGKQETSQTARLPHTEVGERCARQCGIQAAVDVAGGLPVADENDALGINRHDGFRAVWAVIEERQLSNWIFGRGGCHILPSSFLKRVDPLN